MARNKYQDDKQIRWIIAQKPKDGRWEIRYLCTLENVPTLEKVLDETPVGQIKTSEFGVFKNRPDWWEYRPTRYYRGFETKDVNFRAMLGGLINRLESDWF